MLEKSMARKKFKNLVKETMSPEAIKRADEKARKILNKFPRFLYRGHLRGNKIVRMATYKLIKVEGN